MDSNLNPCLLSERRCLKSKNDLSTSTDVTGAYLKHATICGSVSPTSASFSPLRTLLIFFIFSRSFFAATTCLHFSLTDLSFWPVTVVKAAMISQNISKHQSKAYFFSPVHWWPLEGLHSLLQWMQDHCVALYPAVVPSRYGQQKNHYRLSSL